jgi:hypothetical protein
VILSVSTVKDAPGNVEKWVRRNLAGGIDHLVVCLDAPQPDVEALLDAHPDVTAVRAHGAWFAGEPAEDLNERQVINAGLVSRLVAGMPWAQWLFHVDGDEVVQVDRERLLALEPEVRAVRLRPVEAVSRWRTDGDPTLFKRLPTEDELAELVRVGILAKPDRRRFFRGHVTGKPGLRPSLDLGLGVHKVLDRDARPVPLVHRRGMRVLHYESPDGEEFVRKWTALLSSGAPVQHRGTRGRLSDALARLLAAETDPAQREAEVRRLYDQWAADDVETLGRLGLLVEIDPDERPRTAPAPAAAEVQALRTLLERAYAVPKLGFRAMSVRSDIDQVVADLQRGL